MEFSQNKTQPQIDVSTRGVEDRHTIPPKKVKSALYQIFHISYDGA